MSKRKIFKAPNKLTSSQGSEDGPSPSNSPAGPKIAPSGQAPVPANPSQPPASLKDWATSGTYGPLFIGSSPSAVLQSSLGNRLRARMGGTGSPEYVMTWKEWDMPSGPPICALRGRKRRTSDKGCIGWQTPSAEMSSSGRKRSGKPNLQGEAQLVPWPTPTLDDANQGKNMRSSGLFQSLTRVAGWATPTASETVRSDEFRKGRELNAREALGMLPKSSPATMESIAGCPLNPRFSLWLQGFPVEWAFCGERVGRSSRKSRPSSSGRISKPKRH